MAKQSFSQKLAQKLRESGLGIVEEDAFSDGSASWVNLKVGDTDLCITFDKKGEKIYNIGLWQDVIEIVDHKKIWGK